MSTKQRKRIGSNPPAYAETETEPELSSEGDDHKTMSAYSLQSRTTNGPTAVEGITVIGEAVRRVSPESAEFLIEITASAPTAAQALRDNQMKTTQVAQSISALGVQHPDMQSISLNVHSMYAPAMQALPPYGMLPQIGSAGSPDVQFGAYHATNTLRVNVREAARVGEVVDAAARAGAIVLGGFNFKVTDEANARRSALESAGKDARAKAELLASSTGKQVGDPIAISEEIVASNGSYMALRSVFPLAFGAGAPRVVGELEYYARVSASFRLA